MIAPQVILLGRRRPYTIFSLAGLVSCENKKDPLSSYAADWLILTNPLLFLPLVCGAVNAIGT